MSHDLNLILPTRCEHFEFKLVEEIVLHPHPVSGHFGRVCLIGLWQKDPNTNEDRLYSICYMNKNENQNFRFSDKTFSVPLIILENFTEKDMREWEPNNVVARIGEHVEVIGDLYYRESSSDTLTNSRHFIVQLLKEQKELENELNITSRYVTNSNDENLHPKIRDALLGTAEKIREKYKPVIQVHGISNIKLGKQLIRANLMLRNILKNQ